jgi:hypothetical protein
LNGAEGAIAKNAISLEGKLLAQAFQIAASKPDYCFRLQTLLRAQA